ncbi:MAG: hypothetical protein CM1200mP16_10110 [Nitrospina sp.]|nr:MAG: hypothetical protein CM1200mP16_10110 [Nitrospina sp.]
MLRVEKQGADFWFETPVEELIAKGTQCKKCGHDKFKKENDILDVWFDSGVSHAAVWKKIQTRVGLLTYI